MNTQQLNVARRQVKGYHWYEFTCFAVFFEGMLIASLGASTFVNPTVVSYAVFVYGLTIIILGVFVVRKSSRALMAATMLSSIAVVIQLFLSPVSAIVQALLFVLPMFKAIPAVERMEALKAHQLHEATYGPHSPRDVQRDEESR